MNVYSMLSDLIRLDEQFDLNEWESEFANSIRRQLDEGRELTEKQIGKIKDIHLKKLHLLEPDNGMQEM